MRWFRRIATVIGVVLGLIAAVGTVWWFLPAGTDPIAGPNSIAELRRMGLGGFDQAVLLRGNDRRHPILLYVHGGPGSAHLPIAPLYSQELEKHFVVAHWDQRGAGASCRGVDWSTVSLEQIVADTIELAEKLGQGEKIFLIGHSWGSLVGALAVQRRPDLFHAYVGTGQLVHRDRQEALSYAWVVEQARLAQDEQALAELAGISPPYSSQREFELQRHWLSEYHGEIYVSSSMRRIAPAALFGREYQLADRLTYQRCFQRSLHAMLNDRLNIDLFASVPRLDVPVFLFTGRHDYNTVWSLVEEWAQQLQAPHVEMVWFPDGGHFLAIEQPEEFQQRLIEKLLPLVPASRATAGLPD